MHRIFSTVQLLERIIDLLNRILYFEDHNDCGNKIISWLKATSDNIKIKFNVQQIYTKRRKQMLIGK